MIIAIESPRNLKCSRKIVRSSLSLDKIWISVENVDGKSGGGGGRVAKRRYRTGSRFENLWNSPFLLDPLHEKSPASWLAAANTTLSTVRREAAFPRAVLRPIYREWRRALEGWLVLNSRRNSRRQKFP